MRVWRVFACLSAALCLASCGQPPPTDKEMAAAFFAHRATFEALRTELCELRHDQTIMRDPAWSQPQLHAADERRLTSLLKEIGATGVKYLRGCQLWIEMWSSGVGRDAAYKKYRYGDPLYRIIEVKEPPERDLNYFLDNRAAIASFEKKITGAWWIELDHWR
jgi:hypothetical protein